MKVVIAIDSYKGSLSSIDAGKAASLGVKDVFPQAETEKPLEIQEFSSCERKN